MSGDAWLVVGLQNPGREYVGTRHNVGADAVRAIADHQRLTLTRNKRVRCEIAQTRTLTSTSTPVVLAVPTSYMNRSGGPVQAAAAWFKIPAERLVVVHDDLDVPVGSVKLKRGGGHAGHNGLRDIDRALGTREYLRVRVGIGRPPGRMPGKEYVLRSPSPADRLELDRVNAQFHEVVAQLIDEGLEPTQNRYHSR